VAQSLVLGDTSGKTTRYRLLDTTRAYALAKLAQSGEEPAVARRHALYYLEQLAPVREDPLASSDEESAYHALHLANVRAALEWSFSEAGDGEVGVKLAAASAQLFLDLAQLGECREWTERAVAADMRGPRIEMVLRAALGHALMLTRGHGEQARTALERALEVAAVLDDHHNQFRLLSGLHMYHRRVGEFSQLLAIAERARSIAQDLADSTAIAAADVMLGASHHLVGNLAEARVTLDLSLRQPTNLDRVTANFLGSRSEAQLIIARTLWLQGFPNQAVDAAREAECAHHKDSLAACQALIVGAGVFIFIGDWPTVEQYLDRLIRLAREHALEPYEVLGLGFKGEMLSRQGNTEAGMKLLRTALNRLRAERFEFYIPWLTCALAEGLAARGHLDQALGLANEQTAAVDRNGGAYNMPELLRVRGALLAQAGDQKAAERCFQQSIALADAQEALSWRLRTVPSLARLRSRQHRRDEARTALAETYARFTEGFETADLKAARLVLEELDRPHVGP
jgi:predicted ATPase